MKDLSSWLRAGDPAADEATMSEAQVEAMRRVVLEAVRRSHAPALAWHQPLAVAATVALTLVVGALAGPWAPIMKDPPPRQEGAVAQPGEPPRQLQFATPGGTRIIWVFDAEFDLKETTP
jgi:hypothetical protein